ncbi:MAG: DNA-processing protein DprA [Clostridia bacterium]|nr:DNA-processing protein DprA [Clostridia bacterium]
MEPNVNAVWIGLCLTPASHSISRIAKSFSSPDEVYSADDEAIRSALCSHQRDIRRLLRRDLTEAEKTVSFCSAHGISILTWFDEDYPASLREIEKPPAILFLRGDRSLISSTKTVGVVGTRTPSDYAARMTFDIATDLATVGAVVVSGMAYGIDGIAAAGALASHGKTVAVLGCGLDLTYPAKHGKLRAAIEQNGLTVSEYPPGSPPERFHFPERNRIISGLSGALFVAEGTLQSGAMITAEYAAKQGKQLFALPGRLDSPLAEGPMKLMKEGAHPVSCADDILSAREKETPGTFDLSLLLGERPIPDFDDTVRRYGVALAPNRAERRLSRQIKSEEPEEAASDGEDPPDLSGLSNTERAVYEALYEPHSSDELSRNGLEAGEVLAALTTLEIRGYIRSLPGGRYQRTKQQ